jgi:hypothetical protein
LHHRFAESGAVFAACLAGGVEQLRWADVGRSRLEGAMQQIERAERLLMMLWREKYATVEYRDWRERHRVLDGQSEQVRSAAMTVLEQFLA